MSPYIEFHAKKIGIIRDGNEAISALKAGQCYEPAIVKPRKSRMSFTDKLILAAAWGAVAFFALLTLGMAGLGYTKAYLLGAG